MIRIAVLVACALWGSTLSAQVSGELCLAVWEKAVSVVPDAEVSAEVAADGPNCVAREVRLTDGPGTGEITADTITWSGQGLEAFADQLTPPRALVLSAEGFSAISLTGDPVFDYVVRARQSQQSVAIRFEARWDALTGRLVLDVFDIDFPGDNRLRLTGRAEGADLSSLAAMVQSLATLAVTELTFDITSNGLVEQVALEPLMRLITRPGTSPEESMALAVGLATTAIEDSGDAVLSGPTRAALLGALQSLPAPKGALRLTLAADPPLVLSTAVPIRLGAGMTLAERLSGLRLSAQFVPTATLP